MEPLLTLKQVAKLMGLSYRTIKRYVADGTLPVIRDERLGLVRIDPADLRAWIAARRSHAPDA